MPLSPRDAIRVIRSRIPTNPELPLGHTPVPVAVEREVGRLVASASQRDGLDPEDLAALGVAVLWCGAYRIAHDAPRHFGWPDLLGPWNADTAIQNEIRRWMHHGAGQWRRQIVHTLNGYRYVGTMWRESGELTRIVDDLLAEAARLAPEVRDSPDALTDWLIRRHPRLRDAEVAETAAAVMSARLRPTAPTTTATWPVRLAPTASGREQVVVGLPDRWPGPSGREMRGAIRVRIGESGPFAFRARPDGWAPTDPRATAPMPPTGEADVSVDGEGLETVPLPVPVAIFVHRVLTDHLPAQTPATLVVHPAWRVSAPTSLRPADVQGFEAWQVEPGESASLHITPRVGGEEKVWRPPRSGGLRLVGGLRDGRIRGVTLRQCTAWRKRPKVLPDGATLKSERTPALTAYRANLDNRSVRWCEVHDTWRLSLERGAGGSVPRATGAPVPRPGVLGPGLHHVPLLQSETDATVEGCWTVNVPEDRLHLQDRFGEAQVTPDRFDLDEHTIAVGGMPGEWVQWHIEGWPRRGELLLDPGGRGSLPSDALAGWSAEPTLARRGVVLRVIRRGAGAPPTETLTLRPRALRPLGVMDEPDGRIRLDLECPAPPVVFGLPVAHPAAGPRRLQVSSAPPWRVDVPPGVWWIRPFDRDTNDARLPGEQDAWRAAVQVQRGMAGADGLGAAWTRAVRQRTPAAWRMLEAAVAAADLTDAVDDAVLRLVGDVDLQRAWWVGRAVSWLNARVNATDAHPLRRLERRLGHPFLVRDDAVAAWVSGLDAHDRLDACERLLRARADLAASVGRALVFVDPEAAADLLRTLGDLPAPPATPLCEATPPPDDVPAAAALPIARWRRGDALADHDRVRATQVAIEDENSFTLWLHRWGQCP